MFEAPKNNEAKEINLEDFVTIDGRVYIMGDVSGTMTKFLPMAVPPEVEKEVQRLYNEMPDGAKARERNNARYFRNGTGYLVSALVL
ncbi:MAG: hypothetical protein WC521_03595 [Bdellovibrionales bacterium]